jgi:uncharacterized protein (TIGR03067 family)
MNIIKTCLITFIIAFALLSCGATKDAARSTDQANIQGAWLAQTESQNGIKKNVSFGYVFKGDIVTFTDETGKEVKYSFRLDTTGNPRFIVIKPMDTPGDPAPVYVGYELNGNSLKIVVAPAGLRPKEISDKNDQELIICRRKGS